MPLYEFYCQACESEYEEIASIGDTVPCPKCGNTTPKRLISAPSAPGTSKDLIKRWRRVADAQGHFSNYDPGERQRILEGKNV